MYFTTDTVANAVSQDSEATDEDFSFDKARTVTISNPPWTEAFDTDSFYVFDTIVARPIKQQYVHDGELKTFKKPAEELKKAAWSLDNKPYPLTHPESKVVTSMDDVHGFHRNPRYEEDYDENGDALLTSLYIPRTDDEAIAFLEDNRGVSVGLYNDLEFGTDETDIDAYQTDLYFDHAAGVKKGRCSLEDGCGVSIDSDNSQAWGSRFDDSDSTITPLSRHIGTCSDGPCQCGLHTDKTEAREERNEYRYKTKEAARNAAEELDCADGDDTIHSHERDDGVTIYMPCQDHATFREQFDKKRGEEFEYDAVATIDISESQTKAINTIRDEHDEKDTSEISPNLSTLKSVYRRGAAAWQQSHASGASQQQWALARVREFLKDLRSGNALNSGADNDLAPDGYSPPSGSQEPQGDSSRGKSVSDIDLTPPEAAQNAAQMALEARDDDEKTVNGMTDVGWNTAQMLESGAEIDADDVVGGADGMANWWSRHASHTVERVDGTLRLKGTDKDNPWADNSYTAGKGWGDVSGYKWAIRKGNEIKRARDEEPNYSVDSQHTTVAGVTFSDTMGGKLDESAIPSDDYTSHYLYDGETKSESSYPVVDADGNLRRGNVESAHQLGARGDVDADTHQQKLGKLANQFDDLQFDTDTNSTMSDEDGFDFDTIVGGMTVDAVAEYNEQIADLVEDKEEQSEKIDVLEDKVAELETTNDELAEKVEAFEEGERQPKSTIVDDICDLTSAWDEGELMDLDHAELERRKRVATDAAQSASTVDEGDGSNADEEPTHDSDTSSDDGRTVADKHRSWA